MGKGTKSQTAEIKTEGGLLVIAAAVGSSAGAYVLEASAPFSSGGVHHPTKKDINQTEGQ